MKGVFTPMAGWARRTNKGFYREHSSFGSSLSLNFINDNYSLGAIGSQKSTKSFSDIITFTRASGGGRFNAQGQYEWLPANQPRIDYDPVTGAPRGLLIEEQRTNLLTYSEQFDNAAWTKAAVTVSTNILTAPDGSLSADKITENTASSQHEVLRLVAVGAGSTHTYSIFMKKADRKYGYCGLYIGAERYTILVDLDTGAVVNSYTGTETFRSSSVVSVGNGWYRLGVSMSSAAAANLYLVAGTSNSSNPTLINGRPAFTGDGTSGIYIWGAQLEAGSFPTSYIPTVDSQVTRSADVASVNTLSPWYNATDGTIVVKATRFTTSNSILYQLINDTSNRIWCRSQGGGAVEQFVSTVGGVNQAVFSPAAALTHRSAFAYKANDFAVSLNGASALTDVSGSVPSGITRLDIGHDAALRANGHIQSIEYYPRRLSNTELQEITA